MIMAEVLAQPTFHIRVGPFNTEGGGGAVMFFLRKIVCFPNLGKKIFTARKCWKK